MYSRAREGWPGVKWDWKTIVILTGTVGILAFGVLNVVDGSRLMGAILLAYVVLSLPRVVRYTRKGTGSRKEGRQ